MIRINLLPYSEKEKKAGILRQVVIIAATLVVFFILVASAHIYIIIKVSNLEKTVVEKEARLAELTKKVAEVDLIKKDKMLLEKKLAAINDLEVNRLYPVRLLDEFTTLVPSKDVWLEKMSAMGTNLQIEGVARNNIVIGRFMKKIENSSFIQSVDLISAKQVDISGTKYQRFAMSCVLKKEK